MPRGCKRLQPKLGAAGILDLLLVLELAVALDNKQACAAIGTTVNVAAVHVHGLDYKAAAALVSVEFQSVATVTHMKYQLSHIHI